MNGRDIRETERNIRSEEFLTANKSDFANIEDAMELISALPARIAKVREEYENQIRFGADIKSDYDIVRDNFDELLAKVKDVRDTAKTMARKIPGINELFRLPDGIGRRALAALAHVFADNAAQYQAQFDKAGLKQEFFDSLRADADELDAALNEAAGSTGERVGATGAISVEVKAASDIVEDMNPFVRRVYRNNPAKLAQWNFVRKVEKHTPVPRVPKTPEE